MELLFIIILFAGIGFSTIKLNRVLQQRRQAQRALELAEADQNPALSIVQTGRMDRWLQGTIAKLQGTPVDDPLVPQFRAWVETALSHEANLQSWLLALSPAQLQALVEHVAAYCEQLKVNLTWLTASQSDVPSALKNTAQEIVVGYCMGIWKATQIKTKLDLFTEYQNLTQPTMTQQQQILQRELLARLVTQKLVPTQSLAATFLGTEAERQAKVLEAIQQVATKDWERFFTVLQTPTSQNGVYEAK